MKDIKFSILPLEKLVEVVSQGIGRVSTAFFYKKDVDARAYEMRKIAEAKVDEAKTIVKGLSDAGITGAELTTKNGLLQISKINTENITLPALSERTENRVSFLEAKRQHNIENITAIAAQVLQETEEVSEEPVDDDWINRFFRYAEDISNEEMQALWGRILAGEVKQPKTFPLRTLDILKNLTKEEAETFIRVASYSYFDFPEKKHVIYRTSRIDYNDIILLVEAGILQSESKLLINFELQRKGSAYAFKFGNMAVVIKSKADNVPLNIPTYVVNNSAQPLFSLIDIKHSEDFVIELAKQFDKKNDNIEVTCLSRCKFHNESINYEEEDIIELK